MNLCPDSSRRRLSRKRSKTQISESHRVFPIQTAQSQCRFRSATSGEKRRENGKGQMDGTNSGKGNTIDTLFTHWGTPNPGSIREVPKTTKKTKYSTFSEMKLKVGKRQME